MMLIITTVGKCMVAIGTASKSHAAVRWCARACVEGWVVCGGGGGAADDDKEFMSLSSSFMPT